MLSWKNGLPFLLKRHSPPGATAKESLPGENADSLYICSLFGFPRQKWRLPELPIGSDRGGAWIAGSNDSAALCSWDQQFPESLPTRGRPVVLF